MPKKNKINASALTKSKKLKKINRILDRLFGFMLVGAMALGISGLGIEYVLVKGPSESLGETFVTTMLETNRFKWVPNIFLTENEVATIKDSMAFGKRDGDEEIADLMAIDIPSDGAALVDENGKDKYGLVDDDGDGVILVDIKGSGFVGYMLVVLDPSRVYTALTPGYPNWGTTLDVYCNSYGAVGGINGGGYYDPNGQGTGGLPQGFTVVDGVAYNEEQTDAFAGFDSENHLIVGYYSLSDVQGMGIRCGVSFGPPLIINGKITNAAKRHSGVSPRTAIAQREDGAVLMLAIDGRQAHSSGATYEQVAEVLLKYGAVNATNLDGGSSTTMYFQGNFVNSCSSLTGTSRLLATAFLIRPEE